MAKDNKMFVILAIVVVGYFLMNQGADDSVVADDVNAIGGCPDSAATVSFSAVNALSKGTSVGTTQTVKVNGGLPTAAATSYAVGTDLEILWNATNFIDTVTTHTVTCGGGPIDAELYATNTQTIRMFNTNGNAIPDDYSGAGENQSQIASGGSANINVKIDGVDKESSGDLLCVLESQNASVSKLTLSGLGGATTADVPDFYAVSSAGSKAWAYNVPAVIGATTSEGTLGISLNTGARYDGKTVKMTCYSKQAFQETDGSYVTGIEDADSTTKYEDTFDFVMIVTP